MKLLNGKIKYFKLAKILFNHAVSWYDQKEKDWSVEKAQAINAGRKDRRRRGKIMKQNFPASCLI